MLAYAIEKSELENTDSARLRLLDSTKFVQQTLRTEFLWKWVLLSSSRFLGYPILRITRTWKLGASGF